MLLDRYSSLPYHYTTLKVGHLPSVKYPPSPVASQMPFLITCPPLVKAHTKLPILHIRIWQRATVMEIAVRYGYAASIGSLVWGK